MSSITYEKETEQIRARAPQYKGKEHKFTPAEWTHKNGHPRCKLCGDEEPIGGICKSISKAGIPLWDGDGVQGAGQPRNRMGRWISLPGPTDISRIAAFELEGLKSTRIGVFVDDNPRPIARVRSKKAANEMIAEAIRADVEEHKKQERRRKTANTKMRNKVAAEQEQARVAQEERDKAEAKRAKDQEAIFGPKKPKKSSAKPLNQNAPKPRNSSRVEVSEVERLPFPGKPTANQLDALNKWAKKEMPDSESKYAGLIGRLLLRRGVTQDPKVRGEMAEKYGVSAGRLVQIEQDVHEFLFPSAAPAPQKRNYQGFGGLVSPKQQESMERLGVRFAFAEPDPSNIARPERYFKINKGPKKGRFGKVSWNGQVDLVTKREAERARVKSKKFWSLHVLANRARRNKMVTERKNFQNELPSDRKDRKIRIAQKWAADNGFDPSDSYWWAIFWNDQSLLKQQDQEEAVDTIRFVLAEPEVRRRMDPSLLEGILALPDMDSRDMRGHRPGSKRSVKGDDDFQEASPESRRDDPEWESRNRDRSIRHDRRMQIRFEKYKANHPNTKLTLDEFAQRWEKGTIRISKAKNPLWDGDGVQGIGQPRGHRGRWSKTGAGALSAAARSLDLGESQVRQHHGSSPRRTAASGKSPKGTAGNFDKAKKTIRGDLKIKRPQKGSSHITQFNGKNIPRKTQYTPEQAYYHRNNGPKMISNARLKEIFEDRSKATQDERDLISSASSDVRFDGSDSIRIASVRSGGASRVNERYVLFKNLKTLMGQDYAKSQGAKKGAGGQVLLHGSDQRAVAQREKDNKKRVLNGRNKVNVQVRQQMLSDFGDGNKAKCIFCGKMVNLESVSPERMKPGKNKAGKDWGKYERGNIAPAHVSCNTKMGTAAQHNPEAYYEAMMKLFMKQYRNEINKGRLGFVFAKHRGKLVRPVRGK